jgi:hypothetical protein
MIAELLRQPFALGCERLYLYIEDVPNDLSYLDGYWPTAAQELAG